MLIIVIIDQMLLGKPRNKKSPKIQKKEIINCAQLEETFENTHL